MLLATWLVLMALTAGSFRVGAVGAAGATTAALVMGLATLKAHLVAGVFMELLHAPRVFAVAMVAFFLAQAALIVALFA